MLSLFLHTTAGSLLDLLSVRRLTWNEKGLDEFAFTAKDEARKSLEPFARRHVRFGIHPSGEQDDLVFRDVPLTHPCQKMHE